MKNLIKYQDIERNIKKAFSTCTKNLSFTYLQLVLSGFLTYIKNLDERIKKLEEKDKS